MVWFESLGMVSCSHFIATVATFLAASPATIHRTWQTARHHMTARAVLSSLLGCSGTAKAVNKSWCDKVTTFKLLGVFVSSDLSRYYHVMYLLRKVTKRMYCI